LILVEVEGEEEEEEEEEGERRGVNGCEEGWWDAGCSFGETEVTKGCGT